MSLSLSIIVPVYNAAPFLRRCIESVLSQDYTDFELIVVDDGSTDGSAQICNKKAEIDNRVKVLHQKNSGVNTARLNGFKTAKGEYVMFVDSDDILPDHAISLLMQETKEDYDIVRGGHKNIDVDGNITEKETYEKNDSVFSSGEEFAVALHKGLVAPYLWGGVYKKAVIYESYFKRVIDYNLTIGEDCVMNMFISQNVRIVRIIPQTVYLYYINPSSVMHTKIMGREYAHRIDECISDYVESSSSEIKRLFSLNQVKGAISRDFQKEIPFSLNDYRKVTNYMKDKNSEQLLYASMSLKYLLFIKCLPLYYVYSRFYSYYKWMKMGMSNMEII